MDVGARARQHDAIDHIQQRSDLGNLRTAREHQRQRICDLCNRPQILLADHLNGKPVFDAVRIPDHADNRLSHRQTPNSDSGSLIRVCIA